LDLATLIAIISVVCTVLGLAIGYFAFKRERDNALRNDASESAVIKTQLSNILVGIDSIRIDIKANDRKINEVNERVIRVEESAKQAHKRLDHIENKGEM
jgi:peptidoglycan hydrolase CwlO-like protein